MRPFTFAEPEADGAALGSVATVGLGNADGSGATGSAASDEAADGAALGTRGAAVGRGIVAAGTAGPAVTRTAIGLCHGTHEGAKPRL